MEITHTEADTTLAKPRPKQSASAQVIDLTTPKRVIDLDAPRPSHTDDVYPREPLAPIRSVDVLGVRISGVDIPRAVDEITEWVRTDTKSYVCVSGAHGVLESSYDTELTRIHNEAGLVVPDGMPMVWAGRSVGIGEMAHVRGADLTLAVLERAQKLGWSSYFYGGADGVPELLVEKLREKFPDMNVAGCYSPPFRAVTPEEDDEIIRRINASGADLVWVGLSTPKQERWMAAHRDRLHASALLGVGAAFDFHAGLVRQAPELLHNSGLEWLYRLASEPKRLWRRYLLGHSRFAWKALRQRPTLVGKP